MDLSFSAAEVAAVTALLGGVCTALAFMTRQMLAAKQETIAQLRSVIEEQDLVTDKAVAVTADLRDVVREQQRAVDALSLRVTELLRELTDRRAVVNEAAELWLRQHGGGSRREGR